MMAKRRAIHYVTYGEGPRCGTPPHPERDETDTPELVTCKSCLARMAHDIRRERAKV